VARPPVRLAFEHPVHYQLDSADEWAADAPGDRGGLVYLGAQKQPFMLGMVHQLRCLDVIRADIETQTQANGTAPTTALGRHCLNYMRQMITCRGDLYLESFQYPGEPHAVDLEAVYECKDWGAVYDKMERHLR